MAERMKPDYSKKPLNLVLALKPAYQTRVPVGFITGLPASKPTRKPSTLPKIISALVTPPAATRLSTNGTAWKASKKLWNGWGGI